MNKLNHLSKLIKSPLRYPGGKSRAIKQIAPLIPEFVEYREPFVGGGSVFFYLRQQFPDKQFWINDLYRELYLFWQKSQTSLEAVVQQVEEWRNSYEEGKGLYRFLLQHQPGFNALQLASAFFILNRITFSGTAESGGFSQQAFLKRFTPSSIDRLRRIDKVLENIRISNLDYQTVVEEAGEGVFLFLDPPYHAATASALYGKKGKLHKGFDHERFASIMSKVSHKWLITYDDSPYIRELFDFGNIFPWQLTYGMRNVSPTSSQKGKEIFISNYLTEIPSSSKALKSF